MPRKKKLKKNVDLEAQAKALADYEALDQMTFSWTGYAMHEIAEGSPPWAQVLALCDQRDHRRGKRASRLFRGAPVAEAKAQGLARLCRAPSPASTVN
jgi:hypothetical protein